MADHNVGGSGAQPLRSGFSLFREVIQAEREAAEAEHNAAYERARMDHKAALAEKMRLMTDVSTLAHHGRVGKTARSRLG